MKRSLRTESCLQLLSDSYLERIDIYGICIRKFKCERKGNLTIGGTDTVELAAKYGTPLYVMDEQTVRTNCRRFNDSIKKFYGDMGRVHYASKALSCMEMCRIVGSEGLGLDAVSIGELYTAVKAGFDPAKIGFHGNNKTNEELSYAVEIGVGHIIVDNISELHRLEKIAEEQGKSHTLCSASSPVSTLILMIS